MDEARPGPMVILSQVPDWSRIYCPRFLRPGQDGSAHIS